MRVGGFVQQPGYGGTGGDAVQPPPLVVVVVEGDRAVRILCLGNPSLSIIGKLVNQSGHIEEFASRVVAEGPGFVVRVGYGCLPTQLVIAEAHRLVAAVDAVTLPRHVTKRV